MRQAIILASILILFIFSISFAQEQITITTYYPSPYGSYNELQLFPHSPPITDCNNASAQGTMYYDSTPPGQIMVCDGAGTWQPFGGGGFWVPTPIDPNNIYNTNTGFVGIRTDNPVGSLHIRGGWNTTVGNLGGHVYIEGVPGEAVSSGITFDQRGVPGGRIYSISSTSNGAAAGPGKLMFVEGVPGFIQYRMIIDDSGNVGIGTNFPSKQLHCTGQIQMDGSAVGAPDNVFDVAEVIPVADDVEEGDVISIDNTSQKYQFVKSKISNDPLVVGVVSSTQNNSRSIPVMFIGNDKQKEADNPGQKFKYLSIAGQVAVKVCLEGGSIKKGDLLITSSIPGFAMRAQGSKQGTIIGKALENFEGKDREKGKIIMLVALF